MAAVAITATNRYATLVEYTGAALTAAEDWFEVPANAASYTLVAAVTGDAEFTLELEGKAGNTWFALDTTKTITEDGNYGYFVSNKVVTRVRLRLSAISSGEPSVVPSIAVAYSA
jgi:microcompartment protein CcmL/EutN